MTLWATVCADKKLDKKNLAWIVQLQGCKQTNFTNEIPMHMITIMSIVGIRK